MIQHSFPFDPTYGYLMESLLGVGAPPAPSGFEEFWRGTYDATRRIAPRPTRRETRIEHPSRRVELIEYDSLDGFRVGGWLVTPRDGQVRSGVVVGHGYGGREAPDLTGPDEPVAKLFPCARGFHRSARPELPNNASAHVIFGIESRDTYLHRACVADLWAGVTTLLELFPHLGERMSYVGGSFGGGMGALAVPWDRRITRAALDVPSFGNHPLRLSMQCNGSGESVRWYAQAHPEVIEVLKYFDSATAAGFINIPTLVGAARFDPAVPPPGQFAVFNALAGEKKLFVRTASHFDCPEKVVEDGQFSAAVREWRGVHYGSPVAATA